MRNAFVAAAMFLMLCATPALAAQQTVEGGGSFSDAPLLERGNHRDSIRLSEQLFYGVELAEGQRLVARYTAKGQRAGPEDPLGTLVFEIYNPLRDAWAEVKLEDFAGLRDSSAYVAGGRVAPDHNFFSQPGVYYLSVTFSTLSGRSERGSPIFKREYRSLIELDIEGRGAPSPSPSPSASTEPSPTRTSDDGPRAAPENSEGTSYVRVYAMTFAGGLVLGLAIAVARRFLSRA